MVESLLDSVHLVKLYLINDAVQARGLTVKPHQFYDVICEVRDQRLQSRTQGLSTRTSGNPD